MKRLIAPVGVLCVLAGVLTASVVRSAGAAAPPARPAASGTRLIVQIDRYRALTWRWERVLGLPHSRSDSSARRSPDLAYRRWVLALWRRRAAAVERRAGPWLAVRIRRYRQLVDHWQRVMGAAPSAPSRTVASARTGLGGQLALYTRWRSRARVVLRRAQHPPYAAAWQCIHRFEGSWTDGGAPYYGGLQMDLGFQQRYGSYLLATKGTADHWTPLEQMWVAARAARSGRGFWPWPNSARICGLI